MIFEGSATEACRGFPANVNVVAALSLAGIGPERTRIRIYAVPGLTTNQHRIRVEGEFGRLVIEVENVPSENPRTGRLSYLSTIALLRDLGATLHVGTLIHGGPRTGPPTDMGGLERAPQPPPRGPPGARRASASRGTPRSPRRGYWRSR